MVKEYVACVVGAFPEGPACVVDAPLLYDYKARRLTINQCSCYGISAQLSVRG